MFIFSPSTLFYFDTNLFYPFRSSSRRVNDVGTYSLILLFISSRTIKLCEEVSTKYSEMRNPVDHFFEDDLSVFYCD